MMVVTNTCIPSMFPFIMSCYFPIEINVGTGISRLFSPEEGSVQSQYVSQRCYFAFHLHPHPMEPSDLFIGGRFLQQYIVNAWVSIEDSMLFWVHCHMCLCSKDQGHAQRCKGWFVWRCSWLCLYHRVPKAQFASHPSSHL
jgi:hypothetical protein